MTGSRSAAAITAAISLLAVASADACTVYMEPKLTDVRHADAVVVGYVTKDVRETSPAQKTWLDTWLADNPDASRNDHRDARSVPDRARLTVEIVQPIAGKAPSEITVNWYQMINNGPPERIRGGYVMALRKETPSTSASGEDTYAVMQGICSGALVFRRGSPKANAIREMFGLWPEPLEAPRKTIAESFQDPPIPWPTLIVYGLLAAGAALVGLVVLWPRRRRP